MKVMKISNISEKIQLKEKVWNELMSLLKALFGVLES